MPATPAILEVVSPAKAENLNAIANEIRETHALARTHAKLAIAFAVRCGLLCDRAKAALPNGQFDAWLKEQGLDKMTAWRNRQLSRSSTMELLPAEDLTAPDFLERVESDKKFRAALAAKVHDVAGEATVTEVMKDLGIIKPPANVDPETNKRVHYPATKTKKLSPEQIAQQNRAAAKARIVQALGALKDAVDDKNVKRFLQPKDWVDLAKLAHDRMAALDKLAAKAAAALANAKEKKS